MNAMRSYQLDFQNAVDECTLEGQFLNAFIYWSARDVDDFLHLSPSCQSFSPAQTRKPKSQEDVQVIILCVTELVKKIKPRGITMKEIFDLRHEMNRDFFQIRAQQLDRTESSRAVIL